MKSIFKILTISIITISIFTQCITDIEPDVSFNEKTYIFGYLPTYDSALATIGIYASVPLNSSEPYKVKTDAKVKLMEQQVGSTTIKEYEIYYDNNSKLYLSKDTNIAKFDHSYWIEVTIDNKEYMSTPTKITNQIDTITYTDFFGFFKEYTYELDFSRTGLEVDAKIKQKNVDNLYFNGFLAEQKTLELLEGIKSTDFELEDYKYSTQTSEVLSTFFIQSKITPVYFAFRIPNEKYENTPLIENYIRSLNKQSHDKNKNEGTTTEDGEAFNYLFQAPKENIDGNITLKNGNYQSEVFGIFFPCETVKIHLRDLFLKKPLQD